MGIVSAQLEIDFHFRRVRRLTPNTHGVMMMSYTFVLGDFREPLCLVASALSVPETNCAGIIYYTPAPLQQTRTVAESEELHPMVSA